MTMPKFDVEQIRILLGSCDPVDIKQALEELGKKDNVCTDSP